MQQLWFTVIGFHTLVAFLPISLFVLYKWPQTWQYLLAVFLGLLIAFLDHQSDDPQLAVLLLLVFGVFLGFAQPEGSWRWAMLLGAWLPLLQFLTILVEGKYNAIVNEGLYSFFALLPAFLGTYIGVGLRWAAKTFQSVQ